MSFYVGFGIHEAVTVSPYNLEKDRVAEEYIASVFIVEHQIVPETSGC
jgi:hypothetical protein